jgi:hypothetical protein
LREPRQHDKIFRCKYPSEEDNMPTSEQAKAVPSAQAERFRNHADSRGVWIYAAASLAVGIAILAIVYLA